MMGSDARLITDAGNTGVAFFVDPRSDLFLAAILNYPTECPLEKGL